jgi:PAS domain-containing protein
MNEDDHTQEQRAQDVSRGKSPPRTNPVPGGLQTPLRVEGSWSNLLTLMEILPDSLVLVDSDGCIRRVNNQAEALFGFTGVDLEGLPLGYHTSQGSRTTQRPIYWACGPRTT